MDIATLISTVVVVSIISLSVIVFFVTKTYNNYLLSVSHKKEMEDALSLTKEDVYKQLEQTKSELEDKINKVQAQTNKLEVRGGW